jgi:hypothetical protein
MNKIKLSFPNKEYGYNWIINDKAVICGLRCKVNIHINGEYINKLRRLFPNVSCTWETIIFDVTGIAKCHANDTYNEEYGRKLAESRAKEKAYSIANRFVCAYYNMVMEDFSDISDFIDEMARQYSHEQGHIEYLIDNE